MIIDQTFLQVHPRTLAWWAERETCLKCKHSRERPIRKSSAGGGLLCMATRGGPGGDATCISARERECGPGAKLFEAMT